MPSGHLQGPGPARDAAAQRLRHLLAHNPEYRARWERHALHHRGSQVHQAAVAQVLAHHLWDTGQAAETDLALARRLKDVVSRALSGRVLSARTLRLFTEAFGMTSEDTAILAAERAGGTSRGASGFPAPVGPGTGDPPLGISGPGFRTLALHELHTVGPGGLPTQHRTVHLLRALDRVNGYRYLLDTDQAQVRMLRGGTCGPVHRHTGRPAVDITLARPLAPGETASVEFVTRFQHAGPPEPVFHRGGGTAAPAEHVEVHLRFHPQRLPDRVWWIQRPHDPEDGPGHEEPVDLDPDHCVHHYLDVLTGQSMGFRWQFPGVP